MPYTIPTVTDFKAYFVRDFQYGDNMSVVMNADITKALTMAGMNVNEALWATQAEFSMGFLLLTAHYLVTNLMASSQGVNGSYQWMLTNKGAGSVSSGYQIPERVMADPYWAMLSKTFYGAEYLMLLLPQMVAQTFSVAGRTRA